MTIILISVLGVSFLYIFSSNPFDCPEKVWSHCLRDLPHPHFLLWQHQPGEYWEARQQLMVQSFLANKKKSKTAQGMRNLESHRHSPAEPWVTNLSLLPQHPCNWIPGLLSQQWDTASDTRRGESGVGARRGEGKESNLASGEMDCEHTEDVILLRLLSVSLSLSLLLLLKA